MRNLQKKKNVYVKAWYSNGREIANEKFNCELFAKRFTEKLLAEKTSSKIYIVIKDDSNELFRGYTNKKVLV